MRSRYPSTSNFASSFGPGPVTPAIKAIMIASVAGYLGALIVPAITLGFGLRPADVVGKLHVWQLVTYMFLHGGVFHILFNMLALWMFGVELERMWGSKFFTKYYFVTGVGAALLSVVIALLPFGATHATYDVTIIGASGALYGLLLAYALYFPDRPILMFLFFPVPAKYFVMILGAIAFLTSIEGGGTVAATTHLSGLVVGYLYLQGGRGGFGAEIKYRYLKWKMNRMRRKFDIYSGGRSEKARWDRNVH